MFCCYSAYIMAALIMAIAAWDDNTSHTLYGKAEGIQNALHDQEFNA